MQTDQNTDDILLLTSSTSKEHAATANEKSHSQASCNERQYHSHQGISEFTEIISEARIPGNVDIWGGDLVGRWLSENGILKVSGWAVDMKEGLPALRVFLVRDGSILAGAEVDLKRPDVVEALSEEMSGERLEVPGWLLEVPGSKVGLGEALLGVYALMNDRVSVLKLGGKTVRVTSISGSQPIDEICINRIITKRLLQDAQSGKWPKMNVDEAHIRNGRLVVKGWAVSPFGIPKITIYADNKLIGLCFPDQSRLDVYNEQPFACSGDRLGFLLEAPIESTHHSRTVEVRVAASDPRGGKITRVIEVLS